MKRCGACGTVTTRADATFCGSCGSRLAEPEMAASCAACGAGLRPNARFCGACGAPRQRAVSVGQTPVSVHTARPTPVRPWDGVLRQRRLVAAAFLAVALVGAVAGFVKYATEDDDPYPTESQRAVLRDLGQPPLWTLADGPLAPGGETHRSELWLYPDSGRSFRFIDGRRVAEGSSERIEAAAPTSRPSPLDLGRNLHREDVETLLGEEGKPIAGFESPYSASQAFGYSRSRLLVTYLGGRFFTAQPY